MLVLCKILLRYDEGKISKLVDELPEVLDIETTKCTHTQLQGDWTYFKLTDIVSTTLPKTVKPRTDQIGKIAALAPRH